MNDIELPGDDSFHLLEQLVAKQTSQIVLSLVFHLRDTFHLRPFCTKLSHSPVWSAAPIFGVELYNQVTLIFWIGSRGGWSTLLTLSCYLTLQPVSHRRIVASLSLFKVFSWELFPGTVWLFRDQHDFPRAYINMLIFPGGILLLQTAFHQNTIFLHIYIYQSEFTRHI